MSNKSLVIIIRELQDRVAALEAKAREVVTITPLGEAMLEKAEPKTDRKMCPKCGEKPNYFFHVKTCTGQKKNKNDADDQRRDSSKA